MLSVTFEICGLSMALSCWEIMYPGFEKFKTSVNVVEALFQPRKLMATRELPAFRGFLRRTMVSKSKIPVGKRLIGDCGYPNEPQVSIRNSRDSPEVKNFKKRVRARHETFNGRIKAFKALAERFRHGHEKHKVVFESICVIVQYEMENGHPLFSV